MMVISAMREFHPRPFFFFSFGNMIRLDNLFGTQTVDIDVFIFDCLDRIFKKNLWQKISS